MTARRPLSRPFRALALQCRKEFERSPAMEGVATCLHQKEPRKRGEWLGGEGACFWARAVKEPRFGISNGVRSW
jgi:hypothetical protein